MFFKKTKKNEMYTPEEAGDIILKAYKKAKSNFLFKDKLLIAKQEDQYKISIEIKNSFLFDPILLEKYLLSVVFPDSHYEITVSSYKVDITKKRS